MPHRIVGRLHRGAGSRGCSAAGSRAGSACPRGTGPRRRRRSAATPDFELCDIAPPSYSKSDLLAGDRLDHVGAGDEHVRGLLDHEDEVGHRRAVDRAAGARAHDQADLRDHAAAHDVADEHVAVGAERDDALLDPRAAGVVDPDHRAADLGRQVHDLAHLLAHHLAERAAEHGEVLAEHAHPPAVDRAVTGDDGVAVRAGSSACRSRSCGGARTCRAPGTSRDRAASRSARGPCTCRARAASRRPTPMPAWIASWRSSWSCAQLLLVGLGGLVAHQVAESEICGLGVPEPDQHRTAPRRPKAARGIRSPGWFATATTAPGRSRRTFPSSSGSRGCRAGCTRSAR